VGSIRLRLRRVKHKRTLWESVQRFLAIRLRPGARRAMVMQGDENNKEHDSYGGEGTT